MTRILILIVACVVFPVSVFAGPKEDAQAVFDKFLAAFTAADVDGVVGPVRAGCVAGGRGCASSRPRRSRFASIFRPR